MDTLKLKAADRMLWPAAVVAARAGSLLARFRRLDPRPLILRPGGMGDLIFLSIAAEQLGFDPKLFFWIIERRSSVWARHLGLSFLCYDDGLVTRHLRIAGRFRTVINSEQYFGLSQATALLARAGEGTVTCFATNRGAQWADRRVPYDPDRTHETVAFQGLLAAGLDLRDAQRAEVPQRQRKWAVSEKPVVGLGGLQSQSRAFAKEGWAEFITAQIGNAPFWIASSEVDRPFARSLKACFAGQAEIFQGNFDQLCGLIGRAEEVFTVDGGFMHIASYYGTPTTTIFTSSRPTKWSALVSGSRVIRRTDLACQPCAWFAQVPPCGHHLACKEIDFAKHVRAASHYGLTGTDGGLLPVVRNR